MPPTFARLPSPPYYVVVFSSRLKEGDKEFYDATASAMFSLVAGQEGFLGAESARDAAGFGITTAYFTDEAAIRAWKTHAAHGRAQKLGQERWYEHYEVRVARVERAYAGPGIDGPG